MRNCIFFILLLASKAFGQDVWMQPNAGQWDERIEYKIDLQIGEMFIEKNGFTYFLNDINSHLHHTHDSQDEHAEPEEFHMQVIRSKFLNSDWKKEVDHYDSSAFYKNYYLSKDQSKWKSGLHSYSYIAMRDFYKGIDLYLDGRSNTIEYSFELDPGSKPDQIQIQYEGQDKLFIDDDGNLHIVNQFGEIIESKPVAWTSDENGKQKEVRVGFALENDIVRFEFPDGYDQSKKLTIDPSLVFSSFSGSTLDNWGMTATPDVAGNTYAGGIAFTGAGSYPTVSGSFDVTYNGGTPYTYTTSTGASFSLQGFDIAISKFNATGTSLIYSTYLGGSANEAPHSMVVDDNGDLFVFGVTSSGDFPVTSGAYDVSFNGGPNIASNELGYPQGADIYVAHFNSAGSALVGATYVGGSGTDGINTGSLNYNYGDPFRGEIIVDGSNIYVSSTSQSTDFPIVGGSQNTLNGTQDAVIFKMNSALTTLQWSTYFGGSGLESGNSLQLSSSGSNIYVTGGTTSSNLPISNGIDLTYDGGVSDGYILKLGSLTGNFQAGTYIGYSEYDQCYFIQLDDNDDVYVFGQSETPFPISSGVYSNMNSGQFIRKFSSSLNSIYWTTIIGGGTGHPEISPTAFLVSHCGDIYLSGWGGAINTNYSNQAAFSSTNGFPTTSNAYQSNTNGSNFYIAVLSQNAATLKYATFMGGVSNSWNHVDGGTSRFDKSGRIYHAVCGACNGNPNGFTTTPGVWSPTNQSGNCNLAAFKFELSTIEAVISDPNPVVCLPNPVQFTNNSSNGNNWYWDFGDGTNSTATNPSHVYPGPGTYYGTLVVSDTNGCYTPDSVDFVVTVGDFTGGVLNPPGPICPGDSYQLEAFGGANYQWSPAQFLDDSTSATPTATVDQTTDFMVIISDTCGIDTAYVTLPVFIGTSTISNDTNICIGESVPLEATGGVNYEWTPAIYLNDPTVATPISTPNSTTTYNVEITTSNGCVLNEEVTINVFIDPPQPVIPDSVNVCEGSSVDVNVSGADEFYWYPNQNISTTVGSSVTLSPTDSMYYYCDFTNTCGTVTDSVFISVLNAEIFAFGDTIVCPGESVPIWATGGVYYQWSPVNTLNNYLASIVTASPTQPTTYFVEGTDENGCVNSDSVFVDLFPAPFVQASPDVYAFLGDIVQLSATTSTPGPLVWYPAEFLSCVVCSNPTANPDQEFTYTVSYTDNNGCTASDTVTIYYDPIIYVPNTFTPGEGNINPFFKAEGGNIKTFEMLIFNRWGELIYTLNSIDEYWDGTYNGAICQDGTYVWKITVTDLMDEEHQYVGHVNLLRE